MASFTVRARTTTTTAALATDGRVCACGAPCRKLTVLKESANKGRLFWSCGKGGVANGGCSFFEWAAPAAAGASPARGGAAPLSSSPSQQQQQQPAAPGGGGGGGGGDGSGLHRVVLALAAPGSFTATTTFQAEVMKTLNRYRGTRAGSVFTLALDVYEPLKRDLMAMRGVDVTPVPIALLLAARAAAAAAAAGEAPAPAAPPAAAAAAAAAIAAASSSSSSSAAAAAVGRPAPAMAARAAPATAAAPSDGDAALTSSAAVAVNIHPETWARVLHSFQRTGVQFILRHRGRALVADEMGCGKTTTAIVAMAHYRFAWPLLVVCPSSLRLNWVDELLARLGREGLDRAHVAVIASGRDALPQGARYAPPAGMPLARACELGYVPPPAGAAGAAGGSGGGAPPHPGPPHPGLEAGVVIISYDLAVAAAERGALRPGQFQAVIADESHNLKGGDTKRALVCRPLMQRARFALALSGTPALNRPKELYSQIA